MEKLKGWFKSKKVWMGVAAIIVVIVAFGIGSSSAKVTLEGEKVSYNDLLEKVEEAEKDLSDVEQQIKGKEEELESVKKDKENQINDLEEEIKATKNELQGEESKLAERQDEFDELIALVEQRDDLKNEIEELDGHLTGRKDELETINNEISDKEKELEKLQGVISETGEQPIELIAGLYTVGSDVPAGRYRATNVGRGTNFFVYDSSGYPKVNQILGDGTYADGDFIFNANDGDTIETLGHIKLIPVE
ncbi:hypothetical protein CEY16_13515 [Halalkalibacillus sediminis]|uniref:Uncharacterized protein n=1 Tax=Halalkalibacillus sediminis TaxID=2018042 RepID=A0A2I0QR78_9BACI|nr:hypothetical protein [Halalkalibacillus sediminis]PKR76829.1 hypothetical protein CEY16_13515 [Halalkalibacillus sediminis]